MPKFVQQVAGKSYALIEPRVHWARGKLSLFDGACVKLETIVAPVIATTDNCIDTTFHVVTTRVSTARTSVANHVAPVQAKIGQVHGALVDRSLDFMDSSELLIDRLLPLPPSKALTDKTAQDERPKPTLVYRAARIPLAVPLRVTMIAVDTVLLSGRQVAIKLHVIEAKDWSVEKVLSLKSGTMNVVMAVIHGAHGTSERVLGHQKTTLLFTKLHLPLEDVAKEDNPAKEVHAKEADVKVIHETASGSQKNAIYAAMMSGAIAGCSPGVSLALASAAHATSPKHAPASGVQNKSAAKSLIRAVSAPCEISG